MDQRNCFGCNKILTEPYLRCMECVPPLCYICLSCYSDGKEFGLHENSHPYKIIRNNFSILDPNWTAAEEIKLLDGLQKFGIGNWQALAQYIVTKSKDECSAHYFKCYVNSPIEELPKFGDIEIITPIRAVPIPIKASENPPRPSTSTASREVADYMPGRGDFGFEFDNFAELELKNTEFHPDADDLEIELQFAAVSIYNSRLKERARRKFIIREHGLINTRGNFLFSLRYCKIIPTLYDQLIRFAHLLKGDSFVYCLESLIVEKQLKHKIQQLKEYRKMGITLHDSVPTFLELKRKREQFLQTKNTEFSELLSHAPNDISLKGWLKKKITSERIKDVNMALNTNPKQRIRKNAPPLEIMGMPGYSQLSSKERSLCSVLRIFPGAFIQFKSLLINASDKSGGLKLLNARSLIKIDVNKTKKIFDLLLEEGLIKKSQ